MRAAVLVLALLAPAFASAQDTTQSPHEIQYEPAIGSATPVDTQVEPAMYPAAKAQQEAQVAETQAALPTQRSTSMTDGNLAWGILIFTFLALCIEAFVVVKAQKPWSPQSILRMFGLTFIVPLAVLLIVAGYSETQIAPVTGLLGVIAGYLLGSNDKARASA